MALERDQMKVLCTAIRGLRASALERLHNMAQFPKQEMDILSLANVMIAVYQANPAEFPHSDLPALQTPAIHFAQGLLVVICFRAQATLATEAKDAAFDPLVANMTTQLQQSEVDTANDPGKLELIG